MGDVVVRRQLHECLDVISEVRLKAIEPLLFMLADSEPLVIENDLTDEEEQSVRTAAEEYKKNPSAFVSLDDL
ncbi:hypothetical protein FACS1894188_02740 [Clostridia bacterium]|nr:hypothetical protein FACS1894188_02740 [Clostridia bacterium]